jgi:hypothetical protein
MINEIKFHNMIRYSTLKFIVLKIKTSLSFSDGLAILAIIISIVSFRATNKQFKLNSQNADSLFNVQYANERKINSNLEKIQSKSDSIFLIQLAKTEKQLDIIDQPLKVSRQILKDQINSDAPKIILQETTLQDKDRIIEGEFAPLINTIFKNNGNRFAHNIKMRPFIISEDFTIVRTNIVITNIPLTLGPGEVHYFEYKPRFTAPINVFYYCFQITYLDKTKNENCYLNKFTKYYSSRGTAFRDCNLEEIVGLQRVINQYIETNKFSPIEWHNERFMSINGL